VVGPAVVCRVPSFSSLGLTAATAEHGMAAWQYGACKSSQPRTSPKSTQRKETQPDCKARQGKYGSQVVCLYAVCVRVFPPCAKTGAGVRCRAVYRLSVLCFVSPPPPSPRHRLVLYYIIQTRVADMPWTRRSVTGGTAWPGAKPPNLGSLFLRPTPGRKRGHGSGKGGEDNWRTTFFRLPLVFGPVLANDNEQANGCRGRAGRTKTGPELIGEK
jgi:hypothetical protein